MKKKKFMAEQIEFPFELSTTVRESCDERVYEWAVSQEDKLYDHILRTYEQELYNRSPWIENPSGSCSDIHSP